MFGINFLLNERNVMQKDAAIKRMIENFGKETWKGAESYVWDFGSIVLKLTSMTAEEWATQRILMKTAGPFAKIVDMRPLGFYFRDDQIYFWNVGKQKKQIMIVGLIIQERRQVVDNGTHLPGCSLEELMPPDEWDDELDAWFQTDCHASNASEDGKWIDLCGVVRRRLRKKALCC